MAEVPWGSASDIVAAVSGAFSAIGSILAIGLTVWLSGRERLRAEGLEQQRIDLEYVRRQDVIKHAKEILGALEKRHDGFFDESGSLKRTWQIRYQEYKARTDSDCDRLMALQAFAGPSPSLSIALASISAQQRPEDLGDHALWTETMVRAMNRASLARWQAEDLDRFI